MARLTGLEPATPGVTGRYSNQLSYNRPLRTSSLPSKRLVVIGFARDGVKRGFAWIGRKIEIFFDPPSDALPDLPCAQEKTRALGRGLGLFVGVCAPDVITGRWRHILGLMQPVQIHLGDEIAGDRGCDEQERHYQNLVQGPGAGDEGIDHRRHQQRSHAQCRCFGRRVQTGHAVVQLDQADGTDKGKEPAHDQQGRDDDFGD